MSTAELLDLEVRYCKRLGYTVNYTASSSGPEGHCASDLDTSNLTSNKSHFLCFWLVTDFYQSGAMALNGAVFV